MRQYELRLDGIPRNTAQPRSNTYERPQLRSAAYGYYRDFSDFLVLIRMLKTMTAQSKTEMGNVTHGSASWPIEKEMKAQIKKEKIIIPGTIATHTSHERSCATAITPTTPPATADNSHVMPENPLGPLDANTCGRNVSPKTSERREPTVSTKEGPASPTAHHPRRVRGSEITLLHSGVGGMWGLVSNHRDLLS